MGCVVGDGKRREKSEERRWGGGEVGCCTMKGRRGDVNANAY